MTITEDRGSLELAQLRGADSDVQRDFVVAGLEVRAAADADSPFVEFYGHASVTDTPYELYGGPAAGGWNETVSKGAFKRTLGRNPDVPFKIHHEGMTLARTSAGNLHLREDERGLEVKATLDTRVSIVNDLVLLMEAGNIDEMSFAFRVKTQRWLDAEGEEVAWYDMSGIDRHIDEVDIHKGDVSVVNYGANPHTVGAHVLRSLDDLRNLELTEEEIRDGIAYLTTLLPFEKPTEINPELAEALNRSLRRPRILL
jgi:HK97 family phage prohead protease